MKVYLDTSVTNVWLFGREKEAERFEQTVRLFDAINAGQLEAIVSLYTVQEVCAYCAENFPVGVVATVSRLAVHQLLGNQLGLVSLLNRMERLLHGRKFSIRDASDQSHVISALLHRCDAIITYDTHFQDVSDFIPCLLPEEALALLQKASSPTSD